MLNLPPRGAAVLSMAIAMAMHFGGYEFARSSNLALFTSTKTGFTSPGAFPLAMACVSPFSVLLLMWYGRELDQNGPRVALRHTTFFSLVAITLSALLITVLEKNQTLLKIPFWRKDGVARSFKLSPLIVWASFIFQNSYAHLLYSQQWSFISSIVTPSEGAQYFASIAGLSSLASTVAGTGVSKVVERVGLSGLLGATAVCLVFSMMCADTAYGISEKYEFDPAEEIKNQQRAKTEILNSTGTSTAEPEKGGIIDRTVELFMRVPVLLALFFEVFSFQSLATILNVSFVTKLKSAIADDGERAAWTGKFYGSLNGVSGILQFMILPLTMKRIEPRWVWRMMPLIPVTCAVFQCFQDDPSFQLVAFSFFAAKVMDYSVRNVVNEMVYVPLDFESRYLGKEVIGVFANRMGKSFMSLFLSAQEYTFGNFGIQELSRLTAFASVVWAVFTFKLSNLLLNRTEAEETAEKRIKKDVGTRESTEIAELMSPSVMVLLRCFSLASVESPGALEV